MKARVVIPLMMVAGILGGTAERRSLLPEAVSDEPPVSQPSTAQTATSQPPASSGTGENIDPNEKAAAAQLKPAKDPVWETIEAAKLKTRQAFNSRDFDALETEAAALRKGKETFGNGFWKIEAFYSALECDDKEPASMWQLHESIYQAWMTAKPQSITALVAYGGFLTDYAWQARGSGYADKVTEEGWKLFGERLDTAGKVLMEARKMEEKDPCLWLNLLTVALGQGWEADIYKKVLDDARSFEPKFWSY